MRRTAAELAGRNGSYSKEQASLDKRLNAFLSINIMKSKAKFFKLTPLEEIKGKMSV